MADLRGPATWTTGIAPGTAVGLTGAPCPLPPMPERTHA